MTQVGGLDLLLAWGIFVLMLLVLLRLLLRPHADPLDEASRSTTEDNPERPGGR